MISALVKTFYDLAREHKLVRSFKYDRLSKGAGVGSEMMPHVFLEDPLFFGDTNLNTGVVPVTVNFDVVITPQMLNNFSVYPSTEAGQALCESIAKNFIARLKQVVASGDKDIRGIVSWNIMTLKHWYDNDADGVRVTLVVNVKNDINFCDTEAHFDEDKEFKVEQPLADIDTDNAAGCAVFSKKKLPTFNWG